MFCFLCIKTRSFAFRSQVSWTAVSNMGNYLTRSQPQTRGCGTSVQPSEPTQAQQNMKVIRTNQIKHIRYSQHELLVFGYIRNLGLKAIISADIFRLCYRYYSSRKWIFAKGHAIFHMLDVSTPQLIPNVIDFSSIKPDDHPNGRLYCLIPDISTKIVSKLLSNSNINPKHSFLGVLTEDQGLVYPKRAADWMTLYIFQSVDGIPRPSSMIKLAQKPLDSNVQGVQFDHLFYCGSHGVIGVRQNDVYQMKMSEIDEHLQFRAIHTDSSHSIDFRHYQMLYVEERDVILAYDLVKTRNQSQNTFQCAQFSFVSNKWSILFKFDAVTMKSDIMRIFNENEFLVWNMCYDRNSDALYVVSNKYHVMRYDMKSAAWSLIMDGNVKKVTPLCTIWMSQTRQHVICGLERGTLIFKRFDLEQSTNRDAVAAWKTFFLEVSSETKLLRGLRIFQ